MTFCFWKQKILLCLKLDSKGSRVCPLGGIFKFGDIESLFDRKDTNASIVELCFKLDIFGISIESPCAKKYHLLIAVLREKDFV